MTDQRRAERFRYDDYQLDPAAGTLTCRYSVGGRRFAEQLRCEGPADWSAAGVEEAARLVFLLAGVSYYKTAAPPVVDLGDLATTAAERAFLRQYLVEGLGEFAYGNDLDLTGLEVVGPDRPAPSPVAVATEAGRPLVPFGGGIDSIVTVEAVRQRAADPSLFVVSREGDRFAALEQAAAVTGLPVVRVGRRLDDQVLRSTELGFLNGHVPVTGILSATAVLAAVLGGHDAVVMANEWSASAGNLEVGGRTINHQWSKSAAFETGFASLVAASVAGVAYFSLLRPYSELWVAERFARLERYHRVFRSCNRAFTVDPARRLDHWCGRCDKCCFIDLVLAPFLAESELSAIFDGHEPLGDPTLAPRFETLVGLSADAKPFECVGDVDECRTAVALATARPDRLGQPLLAALAEALAPLPDPAAELARLRAPLGPHAIPDAYAPGDLLV